MSNRNWRRLLEFVERWAVVVEVPGGLRIRFEQPTGGYRTIEVVMTPAQWDTFMSIMSGTGEPRDTRFMDQVINAPKDAPFLVYDTYDWWPSQTREIVEDRISPEPGTWVPQPVIEED